MVCVIIQRSPMESPRQRVPGARVGRENFLGVAMPAVKNQQDLERQHG